MSLSLRGLFFAGLIALCGIATQWVSFTGAALFWRVGAALMLLALIYEAFNSRQLRLGVSADISPMIYLGRPEIFKLKFRKNRQQDINLEYRFSPQASLAIPDEVHHLRLTGLDDHIESQRLTPLELGDQQLPKLNFRVLGCLGFSWWHQKQDLSTHTTVAPDYLGRAGECRGMFQRGESVARPIGSGLELHSLRDYQVGDPHSAIDWRATARVGRLITRQWTEDQHLELMIAIDVSKASRIKDGRLSRLGHFSNVAAQLTEFAVHNDDKVGLLVFADEPLSLALPGRGIAGVKRVRNALTAIKSRAVESSPISAMLQLRKRLNHRCLVVILSDIDAQKVHGQLNQAVQLLMPKHSTLVVSLESAKVRNLVGVSAKDWLDPYISLAASEYLSSREAGIRQLTRKGCHVISASADQLAHKVMHSYQVLRQRHQI